jgi:LCP family protein required for cell wall assembly
MAGDMRQAGRFLTARGLLRPWIAVSALALLVASGWWLVGPLRGTARSQSAAAGIHRLQGASWHPELGQLLFVAILGSDARGGPPDAGGGCDAVHVVAINPQRKSGTIVNFPRDSFLDGRKLTDICRQSGFDAGARVLRAHTGFPIQYVAHTQFTHFMALIDELGGLDINVPYRMYNPGDTGTHFEPGPHHMPGGDVLSFTRDRYTTPNGDFGRTFNQGSVVLAGLRKFRADAGDLHRILDYVRVARRHTAFNVPLTDLVRMALLAREIDPGNVKNVTVPGTVGTVGQVSVVFLTPGDLYDRVRDDATY